MLKPTKAIIVVIAMIIFILIVRVAHEVDDSTTSGRSWLPEALNGTVAFVVGLKRCAQRRASMMESFHVDETTGQSIFGIPFVFDVGGFDAFVPGVNQKDGGAASLAYHSSKLNSSKLNVLLGIHSCSYWEAGDPYMKQFRRKMKVSDMGCSISHYLIYQEIVRKQLSYALIIEDDITIRGGDAHHFSAYLKKGLSQLPVDWDILYLDWIDLASAVDHWQVDYPDIRVGCFGTTSAYLITLKAATRLLSLKNAYCSHFVTIDDFLMSLSGQGCPRTYTTSAEFFADAATRAPFATLRSFALGKKFFRHESQMKDGKLEQLGTVTSC